MLCKEFGWDFFTYEAQPNWFIEELLIVMNQIATKDKNENDKLRSKIKK